MTVLKQFLPLALSGTDYLYHYLFQTGNSHSYNVWGFWMSVLCQGQSLQTPVQKRLGASFMQLALSRFQALLKTLNYHLTFPIMSA